MANDELLKGGTSKKSVEEKKAALEEILNQIDKQFGKGSVMNMASHNDIKVDVIPTGCLALDKALGIGGVPKGRIVEIFGPESSGKTTLALHIIAEAQKQDGIVAFVDAEHALDPTYAAALGVDLSMLYVSQPDYGEQALQIVQELASSGSVDVIVVDSVAALTPKAEIDGEMGDSTMGVQARLMSQAMRKLTGVVAKSNCLLVFINQLRDKIGVMFGSPETTTGGKALKFYSSVRIDVRKKDMMKEGGEFVGTKTKAKVVKNKLAPPFREAEFDIIYGQGISKYGCILDMAVELGIVQKSGSWFSYEGEKIAQGREKAVLFITVNPEIAKELEDKIRQTF